MIYPPPEIPSPAIPTRIGSKNLESERRESPRSQKDVSTISRHDSPSQIPDSQPNALKKFVPTLLDVSQPSSPSPNDQIPSSANASPPEPTPRVYQSTVRPPRAASLEPVHLSPPNSPAPTDCSISPDRIPNKFPLLTSTPKSKPLKELLSDSVFLSSDNADGRKNSKFRIQCQKSIARESL